MNKKSLLMLLAAWVACLLSAAAQTPADSLPSRAPVVRKSALSKYKPEQHPRVRVGNDTVLTIIPQKNYGRFDRGLFNYLYVPKGHWAFGFTASYGELSTDDVQLLSVIKDINFKGHLYSLNPSVSYFFGNNQSLGFRVVYTRGVADLGSLALDIDEDMNFTLKDVSYYHNTYNMGIFYRNYVGLNPEKRFAVFNEVALDFVSGSSRFKRYYGGELFDTRTTTTGAALNFSPGVCVFMHKYAAFNVSFGVFGIKFNKEKQTTNGTNDGSRFSSGANFKFNIFNINFGLMVVI